MSGQQKICLWALALLAAANYFVWQAVWQFSDEKLHIYFLDVGQGDAILIRTPDHHNILVDGGPNDSLIQTLGNILPVWDREIDLLVLTHPQADHVTGLFSVLERFKINEILATFVDYDTQTNQEWLNRVLNGEYKVNYASASDDYYFGEVFWDTLWPIDSGFIDDINEGSIVAQVIYGDYSVLLTGDMGFTTESRLLEIYSNIDSTVLKVGHHGSRYASSEEFLSAIKPEVAVISVGQNGYGHPSDDTLNRLGDVGADVYRTDIHGNIEIVFSKESYTVNQSSK